MADAPLAASNTARKIAGRGGPRKERAMNNIFYIIGVVVVVLFVLGYLGFR
jgi:hypothetical protein